MRGKGARVWDSDENEYVDCVGGQGSVNVGHANPVVAEAIAKQAQTLITCPEMFYNDRRAELEQKLTSITGMPRVFLCNSGTESVEAAIKFARLATKRTGIIAAMRGFHGRTFGALSATWEKKYREPFEPLVPDFSHISYNDVASLDEAIDHKTAAVLLEVVQGEGGVRPGTAEFLLKAQEMCRDRGALLILDEVQTGFGRTGKMFAFQHYGLATRSAVPRQIDGGRLPDGRDADRGTVGRDALAGARLDVWRQSIGVCGVPRGDRFHGEQPLSRSSGGIGRMVHGSIEADRIAVDP